jgi:putative ABC transport system ATP-binding protein
MNARSPAAHEPLLSVRGLFKFLGPKGRESAILQDVTFDLEKGRFLCVMGPSGSGKSTLLHLVAGLDAPTTGEVRLAGSVLGELTEAQRTRLRRDSVGFVFQFFNLLPNLTVAENVGLPLAIRGDAPDAKRVESVLTRFGLGEKLSGGQPLLLCDEPTGNLSQQSGLEVMQLLRELVDREGATVLLVTHNPRDAAMADRVLFLVDGRLDAQHGLERPDLSVERVHERLAALHI